MKDLPKIEMEVLIYNPECTKGSGLPFYSTATKEVEVLTLHLRTHSMRIRYEDTDPNTGKKKIRTTDVSLDHFFDYYSIVSNDQTYIEE